MSVSLNCLLRYLITGKYVLVSTLISYISNFELFTGKYVPVCTLISYVSKFELFT